MQKEMNRAKLFHTYFAVPIKLFKPAIAQVGIYNQRSLKVNKSPFYCSPGKEFEISDQMIQLGPENQ